MWIKNEENLETMRIFVFALAAGLCLVACGHSKGESEAAGASVSEVSAAVQSNGENRKNGDAVEELPLPAVPETLREPSERADFLVAHFWDGMDFSVRSRALDSAFVEQNFANFASVLPYATAAGREDGVRLLLDAARKAGEEQIDFLYAVAVNYLYNPESPMYNQEMFLPFADWAIDRGYYADVAQERRADIMKNRVGTVAADFAFELRGGGRSALKALRGTPVMLMFYEPDCSQCHEAEEALRGVSELGRAIAAGELQVLAVYVGENRKLWQEHAATLPQEWLVGIDADRMVDRRELYNIGLTPSFYLLDAEGRVQMKDGTLGHVLQMFGR